LADVRRRDDLDTARGILLGVVISVALWAVIVLLVWA
jgi:hypothetical protein